ncbi:MAG: hypothetical protein VXX86_08830 [Planctomycetota bacterium]|nr:hypothetical protein [Planctomycetota bacterium]MED6308152.1 hypothetical protein [Planctomycetota bacterium]
MDESPARKTIARSLGECVGHIARGLRSSGAAPRAEVRRRTEVEERDGVVLRRTIVEEVELKQDPFQDPTNQASGRTPAS